MKFKNLTLTLFFFCSLIFAGQSIKAQGIFYATNITVQTTAPVSCDTLNIDVRTYLGCINYVNAGYTYTISTDTIYINVNYTSSFICAGAISYPVFNVKIPTLLSNNYTIKASAFIDATFVNALYDSVNVKDCCPASSQLVPNFNINDTISCLNDVIYFNNQSINGVNFSWYKNDVLFSTNNNSLISADSVGVFNIKLVADSANCSKDTTIQIEVKDLPLVNLGMDTTICAGQTLTLSALDSAATYLWQDSTTADSLVVDSSGTYWVKVTNAYGCSSRDSIDITVTTCVSIKENQLNNAAVKVYPIPARNILHLTIEDSFKGLYSYSIIDIKGQLVKEGQINLSNNENSIDISRLNKGIYNLKLIRNGEYIFQKISIQ